MKKIGLTLTALIALIAAFLIWQRLDTVSQPETTSPPSATAIGQAPNSERPNSIANQPIPQPAGDASIEEKVQALAISGTPEQYLDAFQFIERCLQLEREKELSTTNIKITTTNGQTEVEWPTTAVGEPELAKIRKSCSTMTGRTRLDRFALLKYALDHHAPGAIITYVTEGPDGDQNAMRERPNDPLVAEWRKDALARLKADIESGYVDAVMYSTTGFGLLMAEPSNADIYAIHLAANKIIGEINHGDGPYSSDMLRDVSGSLDQQQKNDAQAHAEQIYLNWKRRNHG